ncbi:hypothetical protein PV10_03516 [Exophiala mesophila]|uniref:MOCS2A n=1 Tax=Exophiala mesophila TaxID=212818 RepID=A0A0D1ZPN9_EXOME|nr:uncharacterized protein PV10_03516 [Exophiala mesophila]KIV95919.1 hypothetical protein PV10_03516 [Exophiala mesophila]
MATSTNTVTSTASTTTTTTGNATILLFASAASYCNDIDTLKAPTPTTLGDILTMLERQYPGITEKVLRSSAFTVNLEYVDVEFGDEKNEVDDKKNMTASPHLEGWDIPINPGDEVGVIPPVSSG